MFISLSEQSPLYAGNELLHHSPKFRSFKKIKERLQYETEYM